MTVQPFETRSAVSPRLFIQFSLLSALALMVVGMSTAVSAAAEDQPSPAELTARMAQAIVAENYAGDLIFQSGDRIAAMRLIHGHREGRVSERLFTLSGPYREVVRRGETVHTILPMDRRVVITRGASVTGAAGLPDPHALNLAGYYDLSFAGTGRVAAQTCRRLLAEPRDDYRYGYLFCLHKGNALPLRVQVLDAEGRRIEQFMFTRVRYPDHIPDSALAPGVDLDGFEILDAKATQAHVGTAGHWGISEPLPGFRMTAHGVRAIPGFEAPVEHLSFSDGLAFLSAYIVPRSDDVRLPEGYSQQGALSAYAKVTEDYRITVVGQVPEATVRYVGEHLRHRSDAGGDGRGVSD